MLTLVRSAAADGREQPAAWSTWKLGERDQEAGWRPGGAETGGNRGAEARRRPAEQRTASIWTLERPNPKVPFNLELATWR